MDTAFVQVSLKEGHKTGSYAYLVKVRDALASQLPQLTTYFQVGGLDVYKRQMVLGGIALALSRLIDNSVVVLENIFRHMELGEPPVLAAENGGKEVQLAVLAATCSTCIVFFPVIMPVSYTHLTPGRSYRLVIATIT